jgi:DNA-binding response OmpR family regulator
LRGAGAGGNGFREHTEAQTRILLVVDRAVIREAIALELDRDPSFTVSQAGSLADARVMFDSVDVAILDLGLPDGNGANIIQELAFVNPEASAIVLTFDCADADWALERGAAAVLHKLTDFEELPETIKRLQRRATS